MRFIGKKDKLLGHIAGVVRDTGTGVGKFTDFFAGTGSVAIDFKRAGWQVAAGDILYFAYVLLEAQVANNDVNPSFVNVRAAEKIHLDTGETAFAAVIRFLNALPGERGFIWRHYTPEGTAEDTRDRRYFRGDNGAKIDAIRRRIAAWEKAGLLINREKFILLASLIETVPFYANIAGVYAAFLKDWDPRALKDLTLRPIELIGSSSAHQVWCGDSMDRIKHIDTDVLYLDPPYNARQYAPNYHLLETIARYDDPPIRGVAGIRNYQEQKSDFCVKNHALGALAWIAAEARYQYLMLSYNSEGIMPQEMILDILSSHGEVELVEIDYPRFKSNEGGESATKRVIQEQIYVLRKPSSPRIFLPE